eukprot:TRINITY_DN850_c0_g1_i1.p1 TRINITY_DN850_c0_g1~~TRINITY_DN850_c0_g1_i1.p1  ORF type:complete len:341 (+),score=43.71 TRINITY_DN850_c0_g1_i1:106-1023(+)
MEWFRSTKQTIHRSLIDTVAAVTGPLAVSKFLEEGVLTPEEFVQAGDLLVYKCPTWTWEAGDASKAVPYLPKEKQFLRTRNVPCLMRVTALEKSALDSKNQEVEIEGDEGWVETHVGFKTVEEIPEIEIEGETDTAPAPAASGAGAPADNKEVESDSDIPDMEGFEDNIIIEADDQATLKGGSEVTLRSRSYDLSITYDKYYQTPRVWLFGYDEYRNPLAPPDVFTDISQDHAKKTVTIDTHSHLNLSCAYIHPCRHAAVMKRIVTRQIECGREPRVDQYLFLFLKFLSAVIPTIEYDYTIEMEG